ncbi:rhomboid family intramembrane serine protease [Mucilaginibacter myungsuensis]|uniref:Rhomboid family intramembrane serine protease n=1 Tax=Mucilaginibacter myungsuensis TaxID=649104 RepID=A0A929PWM7_9SPHI|nr:rhomboid family intramembrane serine protease [Mucilaginibacter myungsuensis]MBE9661342.1 rhomboid family intramembrane serine protease [Mucilaginibacter myungsuensis]MDN3597485.1 rhomboid family intramembrane serine protease [Mucilaginibacter myungsuensis]
MIEMYLTAAPVACFIFVVTLGLSLLAFSNESVYGRFLLHPYSVSRNERVYTLISSGFIHRDWGHLFFNMWSYFIFAFKLEVYLGHWQFGFLYMVSMILSDLPTVFKEKDNYGYHSLGASGAISAVVFSFILFEPTSKLGIFPFPFGISSWIFGILYLAYCWYASKNARDSINHDAHFFGAIAGVILTIVLNHNVIPHFVRELTM